VALLNQEHVTSALRFWEIGRLPFNLALAMLTIGAAYLNIGDDPALMQRWLGALPGLFVLAVAANVLYCAAYPVDLLVQASDFRAQWLQWRWLLWAAGMVLALLFASAMLWSFAIGMDF